MKIKLLKEAEEDIVQAMFFYESQREGLGQFFLDSISGDIESLNIYAGIHIKEKSYYKMLAKRFPFAVYYKYEKDIVKIHSILDCRSNPQKTNERLK